ncbi:uncharacterized protein LOC142357914, partial [Convolutriloba macropyga]|uniref:uncharacterized protein LOC142357914 n=1 Tax=Convolutriloba macropyga TaxID=536237 RepID=UPI003F5213AC
MAAGLVDVEVLAAAPAHGLIIVGGNMFLPFASGSFGWGGVQLQSEDVAGLGVAGGKAVPEPAPRQDDLSLEGCFVDQRTHESRLAGSSRSVGLGHCSDRAIRQCHQPINHSPPVSFADDLPATVLGPLGPSPVPTIAHSKHSHMATTATTTLARALGLRAAPTARQLSTARRSAPRSAFSLLPAPVSPAAHAPAPCHMGSAGRSALLSARRGNTVAAAAAAAEAVPMLPESFVEVSLAEGELAAWEGDLIALGVYESSIEKDDSGAFKSAELKAADEALGGVVSELLEDEEFKAAAGSAKFVRVGGKAKYFGLVGLGPEEKAAAGAVPEWGASPWQAAGSAVADAAKSHKAKGAAFTVLGAASLAADQAEKVALGALLGGFESTRFKSKPKSSSTLESLQILSSGDSASIDRAAAMARGVYLTRFLVEAPPNVANPTHLAEAAAMIAAEFPERMSLEVLEKEDCEKLGMGCYLGVAEASDTPPKFIHLTYSPPGDAKRK